MRRYPIYWFHNGGVRYGDISNQSAFAYVQDLRIAQRTRRRIPGEPSRSRNYAGNRPPQGSVFLNGFYLFGQIRAVNLNW